MIHGIFSVFFFLNFILFFGRKSDDLSNFRPIWIKKKKSKIRAKAENPKK